MEKYLSKKIILSFICIFLLLLICKILTSSGSGASNASAGEKPFNVQTDIPKILGTQSSHYKGCGFPELQWGMTVDEVKEALPNKYLILNRDMSDEECEVYFNSEESSYVFFKTKLMAVNRYFPFSGDGSNLISQALELFGKFEEYNHFKTSRTSSISFSNVWRSTETVLYNFEETHAAIIIGIGGGNQQRTYKSLNLSYIDKNFIETALKEYTSHVRPLLFWTTNLIGDIKDDGKLEDFSNAPTGMTMKYTQYTPGRRTISVDGESENSNESLDCWEFKSENGKNDSVILKLERARTNQYDDLPLGNVKGMMYPNKMQIPEIPKYLMDNTHMGLLWLRLNDLLIRSESGRATADYFKQDKLAVEWVNYEPIKAVPYSVIKFKSGYQLELLYSGEIKISRLSPEIK